jgi:hypothetical protein
VSNSQARHAYPTHRECKAGLDRLFEAPGWVNVLEESAPSSAVMLTGGGAPLKDLAVIKALLASGYFAHALLKWTMPRPRPRRLPCWYDAKGSSDRIRRSLTRDVGRLIIAPPFTVTGLSRLARLAGLGQEGTCDTP